MVQEKGLGLSLPPSPLLFWACLLGSGYGVDFLGRPYFLFAGFPLTSIPDPNKLAQKKKKRSVHKGNYSMSQEEQHITSVSMVSGSLIGASLSISISPLCVILVIGRRSTSRCSFSIISMVYREERISKFCFALCRLKKKKTLPRQDIIKIHNL